MRLSTLSEWLFRINTIHPSTICLGLDRVGSVGSRLNLLHPTCPVITVGGTNGKGSTVAGVESIYCAAGYTVGTFTSPYLFKHNEEVRINGIPADDAAFCQAFEEIEQARGDIRLTPFEFHTLAALIIFQQSNLDVMVLEVGLGGRLDAVNIINADVAAITSIGIDHTALLGNTREAIGFEKAGIMRAGKPIVCGDFDPPASLIAHANDIGAHLFCQGRDFHYQSESTHWKWLKGEKCYDSLPHNLLMLQNMSTVLMVVDLMQSKLPVSRQTIETGLANTKLIGRIQMVPDTITEIYDVAHNPDAVACLAERLGSLPDSGKRFAVFSMLADKDILGCVKLMKPMISEWLIAPLNVERAASPTYLHSALVEAGIKQIHHFSAMTDAYDQAKQRAAEGDTIIVFGSFHTVSQVLK